jgi:molybdopterin converting factor small subunit
MDKIKVMNPTHISVDFSGIPRMITGVSEHSLHFSGEATVGELIQKLAKDFPALVGEIIEKDQSKLIGSNVFSLKGEKILAETDLDYQLNDGDQLILLSLLSGG